MNRTDVGGTPKLRAVWSRVVWINATICVGNAVPQAEYSYALCM